MRRFGDNMSLWHIFRQSKKQQSGFVFCETYYDATFLLRKPYATFATTLFQWSASFLISLNILSSPYPRISTIVLVLTLQS